MSLPSVSVVVPVLNGVATIGDMLKALVTQFPVPKEIEILIVDNGSTDGTQDVVARFPQARLLTASRRGPAAARNVGLHNAVNDVILHCDADTLPTRRWISELASCFEDSSVQLAAGNILGFPPATPAERYFAAAQLFGAEFTSSRPVMPFAPSANMAVRRTAALEIGGWNEEMMTAEDLDFSTRLLAKYPDPIRYSPGAVLYHRNRSTDQGLRKQAWTYGEGAADTYRRYPDVIQWGASQYVNLLSTLAVRTVTPLWLRAGEMLRIADGSNVEYAHYHRMWTWWFWAGFFSFRRHGEFRPARGEKNS